MRAELLAVGTELLLGHIANTNAQYLSQQLSALGVDVYHHVTVGDNAERLKEALAQALSRSDAVITTGGLGPTEDDLTKETVADYFGLPLLFHEESYRRMAAWFRSTGREMTKNNEKQAMIPAGALVLDNDCGTAPGCIVEKAGKAVIILPGPPAEMRDMFQKRVKPYLEKRSGAVMVTRWLKVAVLGESRVDTLLADLIARQDNPTIAMYCKPGVVTVRLTAKCADKAQGERLIEPVEREIAGRLGKKYLFGKDGDTLESVTAGLLAEKNVTVAAAESCTGGLVTAALVSVPGISRYLREGLVTYANGSKVKRLGVKEETLALYGAVSRETACEMAQGVRLSAPADVGIATTGIAGPEGGTPEKPVGLVYVAVSGPGGTVCEELRLKGDRNRVRELAACHALNILRNYLADL